MPKNITASSVKIQVSAVDIASEKEFFWQATAVAEKKNKAYIEIKTPVAMFKILMYLFKLSPLCSIKDFKCCTYTFLLLFVEILLIDNVSYSFWQVSYPSSSIVRFLPTKTVDLIRIQK